MEGKFLTSRHRVGNVIFFFFVALDITGLENTGTRLRERENSATRSLDHVEFLFEEEVATQRDTLRGIL